MTWPHVALAAIAALSGAFGLVFRQLMRVIAENKRVNDDRISRQDAYAAQLLAVITAYRSDNAAQREVQRETNITMAAWLGEEEHR
jgi:hypothetical protein